MPPVFGKGKVKRPEKRIRFKRTRFISRDSSKTQFLYELRDFWKLQDFCSRFTFISIHCKAISKN